MAVYATFFKRKTELRSKASPPVVKPHVGYTVKRLSMLVTEEESVSLSLLVVHFVHSSQ